jgi:hypothetical protein
MVRSQKRSITTQSNPAFLAICALFKLETLKIKRKSHHVALRSKLCIARRSDRLTKHTFCFAVILRRQVRNIIK